MGFHISVSEFFYDDISVVPVCDFSPEETDIIFKIRALNSHDKKLLMALLNTM